MPDTLRPGRSRQHLSVTSPHNSVDLLADARHAAAVQRRRLAEVQAREHVGAAGWAQSSTLDAIIRAGQEGLAATEALRQVIDLTGEQLRTLPLSADEHSRADHAATLHGVLSSSEGQLEVALHVNDLIRQALEDVTATPLSEISVGRLRRVQAHVQVQVQALHTIIASAHAQADTLEQVQRLDQMLAEHQERVRALRRDSASQEVEALAEAGEGIVQRIAELDDAAPVQLQALHRIGAAVGEQMNETGASPTEKAQTLETLAETLQEKAQDIRSADS